MATWIFQGARGFDIRGYLLHDNGEKERWQKTWKVSPENLKNEISSRDDAFIWRAENAGQGPGGIIAFGKITSGPFLMKGVYPQYWDDPAESQPAWRVWINLPIHRLRLSTDDGMLTRDFLLTIPELKDTLSILRQRQGTTFRVSLQEAEVLHALWKAAGVRAEGK